MKNALWLFVIAIVIFAGFLPSYTQMQDLKQKNLDYERQIKFLKAKNLEMRKEEQRLRNDPEYLEKIAREKMGIVREGEVVYKITPITSEGE